MTKEDFNKIKSMLSFEDKVTQDAVSLLEQSVYTLMLENEIIGFTTLDVDLEEGITIKNPWKGDTLIIKNIDKSQERAYLELA